MLWTGEDIPAKNPYSTIVRTKNYGYICGL